MARLPELLRRDEADRTGIYVLIGPGPDRAGGLKAYIGEGDSVGSRLRQHQKDNDKDFFDRLAFVISKDDRFTKSHARFVESQLIRMVREAGSVTLANGTAPDFSLLPEADKSDMMTFMEQMRIVLPILGFDLFRPVGGAPAAETEQSGENPIFELDSVRTHVRATARELDSGFVVLAGSTARKGRTRTFQAGYRSLRDQLVNDGKLVEAAEPNLYRFAIDVAFASPSAAASIVMARSASGPLEWRVKQSGLTYGEWRDSRLDPDRSSA